MKVKAVTIGFISIVALGAIAEGFNEAHHHEMALKACKTPENIKMVNSKTYECHNEMNE